MQTCRNTKLILSTNVNWADECQQLCWEQMALNLYKRQTCKQKHKRGTGSTLGKVQVTWSYRSSKTADWNKAELVKGAELTQQMSNKAVHWGFAIRSFPVLQSRIRGPIFDPSFTLISTFPNGHLIFRIFHFIHQIVFKSTNPLSAPSTFIQVTISSHPEHSSILPTGWSTLTSFSRLRQGDFLSYCHPLTWLCTVSVSHFLSHMAFCKLRIAALFPSCQAICCTSNDS